MKVAMIGTGVVGRTLAGKMASLGHEVVIGTRDVQALMARTEIGRAERETFAAWHAANQGVRVASFAEAARHGEVVFHATNGARALDALRSCGAENLNGKVLIDISNPLDFSRGFPPSLSVCNTDSLAEQIQREFPQARLVKTLNTVSAPVMVAPESVGGADHQVFVSGNDEAAKATVTDILKSWFGWRNVLDLGDISAARGMEMYLPLWVRMMGVLQSPMFNVRVVTQGSS
jgi:predicted dinucleotide-binding enzyme